MSVNDTPPALAPWPTHRRLWTLVGAVGLFALTIAVANLFLAPNRAIGRDAFGQDFMAFYSAGRLVWRHQSPAMYDLNVLARTQHEIAQAAGYRQAAAVAPWWNPPFVALPFAPLSAALGFRAALLAWTLFGVACLAMAGALLARIVAEASPLRRHRWLAIAAVFAAPATIQALGHGQNTPLSLLLLTALAIAWRSRAPLAAGVACALLAYKPQLAAIVAVVLFTTLGWRVLVGLMIGGIPALLSMLELTPGALQTFVARVPGNLRAIQLGQPYLWHRHATINAFLRHVLQGNAPGPTAGWITALSVLGTAAVAASLIYAWWRCREAIDAGDDVALDRLIAAVVIATPLLVPFFFDYDLLLLAVAATLIGREMLACPDGSMAARWLRGLGGLTFVWLMVNPPLAEATGVNLTVPMLVGVFGLQAWRCADRANDVEVVASNETDPASCEDGMTRLAA